MILTHGLDIGGLIVSSSFASKALKNKKQINYIFENDPEKFEVRMKAAEFVTFE